MTAKPCPICGVPIEEADLHEHLTGLHKNSPIEEMPAIRSAGHKCVVCGEVLATSEELKLHNASRHRM